MSVIEIAIKAFISEQINNDLPKVVAAEMARVKPRSPWMTDLELAEYWRIYNNKGELTTDSIGKWTARPKDEHPLPCGSVGEMRRYHRDEVDKWAREEAELQRQKRAARKKEKEQASQQSVERKRPRHLQSVESRAR